MFSVFVSSYRNTSESLGQLEKAVETLACGSCFHSISRSPKLLLVTIRLFALDFYEVIVDEAESTIAS